MTPAVPRGAGMRHHRPMLALAMSLEFLAPVEPPDKTAFSCKRPKSGAAVSERTRHISVAQPPRRAELEQRERDELIVRRRPQDPGAQGLFLGPQRERYPIVGNHPTLLWEACLGPRVTFSGARIALKMR